MIRSTTLLTEEPQVEACYIKRLKKGITELLIPNNHIEVLMTFDGGIDMKRIGSPRIYELSQEQVYLLAPRARGTYLCSQVDTGYFLKTYSSFGLAALSKKLKPAGAGIYKFEFGGGQKNHMLNTIKNGDLLGLEEVLSQHIGGGCSNETVFNSVEMIRAANGSITIREIYESLKISKSKLEQHFNKEVGLTPKEFCRIEKLNHFIKSYKSFPELSLTELTYLMGYYDQSHLIKDFNYFLEMNPSKFFSNYAFM